MLRNLVKSTAGTALNVTAKALSLGASLVSTASQRMRATAGQSDGAGQQDGGRGGTATRNTAAVLDRQETPSRQPSAPVTATPPGSERSGDPATVRRRPGPAARRAGAGEPNAAVVRTSADAPAPEGRPGGDETHRRTAESHAAELADRNVGDIVRAVPDLSTDELEQLYLYEQAHRNRKTVLQAVERALEPTTTSADVPITRRVGEGGGSAADDNASLAYSTETPAGEAPVVHLPQDETTKG